jgi:hypothetical protein
MKLEVRSQDLTYVYGWLTFCLDLEDQFVFKFYEKQTAEDQQEFALIMTSTNERRIVFCPTES